MAIRYHSQLLQLEESIYLSVHQQLQRKYCCPQSQCWMQGIYSLKDEHNIYIRLSMGTNRVNWKSEWFIWNMYMQISLVFSTQYLLQPLHPSQIWLPASTNNFTLNVCQNKRSNMIAKNGNNIDNKFLLCASGSIQ